MLSSIRTPMAAEILDKFSNGNPETWVYRAECYFKFLGFSEEDWLPLPYFYLEGEVLVWFDWLHRNKQFYDWNHFKEKLILRFRKWTFADSNRSVADSSLAYHHYISYATLCSSKAHVSPFRSNFYGLESTLKVGNSEAKHVFDEMPTRAFTKAVNETSSVKATWKSTDAHVSISNFAADLNNNQSPKVFSETPTTATSSIHFPSTVGSIPYLPVLKLHASGALFYDGDKSAIDEDKVFDDNSQSTTTAVTSDDISDIYISPMVDEKRDLESLNKPADLVDATEDLDCKAKLMQEGANVFSAIPLAVAYGQSASNFFELEHLIEPNSNTIPVPDGVAHPETLGPKLSNGQMFDKISGWNETGSLISLQLAGTRTTFKYVLDHGGKLVSTFNQLLLVKDCVTRFPFDSGADLFIVNLGGPVTILGVNFKTLSLTSHTEYLQAPLLMGFTVTYPAFHQYYSAEKDPSSDLIELKPGAEVVVNKVPKLFDQNFQKTNTKFARTGTWNISDDLILTINNQSRVELNDFQVCIWVDTGQIIEVGSFCFDLFINNSQDGICMVVQGIKLSILLK
uniref:Uncharacterized protein LOC104234116 n=1 Tax=Nicotiana sylvestris TaxID=4096 RepID=A0A1U7X8D8_NICSY|nr:PREDICTED: uncharacterized protein LOC104234116 [Nicotiana sylvestris]